MRVAVPVARSLARHGVPVLCARFGREQRKIHSRAIQRCFSFDEIGFDDPRVPKQFLEAVDWEPIDYLMPCDDSSLRCIAQHYAIVSKCVKLGCPDAAAIIRVLDKSVTLSLAKQCGIPVPREMGDSLNAGLDRVESEIEFPVVARPKTKLKDAGYTARYFQTIDELRTIVEQMPGFLDDHLVQEYCPGDGVGIEVLIHEGEPRMIFQHRRLTEHPRSGGVSVVAMAEEPEPKLTEMAVRLLRALEWRGVAMVEFRHQRATGRTALMEVNGRFWGSVGLSAVCGFDFPYALWAYDHGLTPSLPEVSCKGHRARWTAGVLLNICDAMRTSDGSIWNELRRSLREFSPAIRDMVFSWSDPIPAICEVSSQLAEVIKASVKRTICTVLPNSLRRILCGTPTQQRIS